ncbi:MAG: hypothetical protein GTO45_02460 [Candidatus Aminicenantes bacterium]|nr:hypothetical protein [Candidatus Aminicenantes bacterium]NIM77592.1 hypothetical protein [Candidatus Aminicenantes bacterium]NIN16906.1 hypothetical protein [Candidatus Aminicenantes bacterium]NIN40799.1 hypothetical protein [Candidatus Aminicenantes bacterium]NIN83603.1 hypothetical protein [Candidatus Aminicenantes bacterium]
MTNIDFKLIANNLELDDGTWGSTVRSDISYFNEGNELCSRLEEDSFWFRHRNNCIIEMVKQFPPGGPLFDVGEHIRDDWAFLKTVSYLLESGGKLYITVPAFRFLWSTDNDYAGHFKRYTLKSMRILLADKKQKNNPLWKQLFNCSEEGLIEEVLSL